MDAGVWQQRSLWDGLSSALYALCTVAFGSSSTRLFLSVVGQSRVGEQLHDNREPRAISHADERMAQRCNLPLALGNRDGIDPMRGSKCACVAGARVRGERPRHPAATALPWALARVVGSLPPLVVAAIALSAAQR